MDSLKGTAKMRETAEGEMSYAMEDYLECIYMIHQSKGEVRVKDVAAQLDVRMPTVNNAIAMLKKLDLVTQEPYGHIEITPAGSEMADKIFDRHKLLTMFFRSIGVSPELAEVDACSVEHVISEETFSKLKEHYVKENVINEVYMITENSLHDLKVGETAEVSGFAEGDAAYKHRLFSLGFTRGTKVRVVRVAPLGDPVEVEIRGSLLSLRKKEAKIILVRRGA